MLESGNVNECHSEHLFYEPSEGIIDEAVRLPRSRPIFTHAHSASASAPTVASSRSSHAHSMKRSAHQASALHGIYGGVHGLWMLLDGVGLAMITAGTILDGINLWFEIFHVYWDTDTFTVFLWFAGRICQVIGLFLLIGHAASFQVLPIIEQMGMALLTVGPLINMCSCGRFHLRDDEFFLFNRQWISTEVLELVGIVLLVVSMAEMNEELILFIELIGYGFLIGSSSLDFEYFPDFFLPSIGIRMDLVHASETFGLMMLVAVAYGQYRIKSAKQLLEASSKNTNDADDE